MDGYKFYCSRGGWNHEVVRRELLLTIVVGAVVVVLGVALAVTVQIKNPGEGWAWGILLAFAALPIYWLVSALVSLSKLRRLSFQPVFDASRAIAVSEIDSSGVASKTTLFVEKEVPELLSLPRPRKLRMTWKGHCYFAFTLAVVSSFTLYALPVLWSESNNPNSSHGGKWLLAVAVAVIYGSALTFFRNRWRERNLLANGEVVSGFITAQSNGRYTPTLQYCFKLAGGRLITAYCNDASRSLYEGMTVPVFYDAAKPSRSIPLDCSLTKVA